MSSFLEPWISSSGTASPGTMGKYDDTKVTVYVGNIDPSVRDDEIRNAFSAFGVMTSYLRRETSKGDPRASHFAFIKYAMPGSASRAISASGHIHLGARTLVVRKRAKGTLPFKKRSTSNQMAPKQNVRHRNSPTRAEPGAQGGSIGPNAPGFAHLSELDQQQQQQAASARNLDSRVLIVLNIQDSIDPKELYQIFEDCPGLEGTRIGFFEESNHVFGEVFFSNCYYAHAAAAFKNRLPFKGQNLNVFIKQQPAMPALSPRPPNYLLPPHPSQQPNQMQPPPPFNNMHPQQNQNRSQAFSQSMPYPTHGMPVNQYWTGVGSAPMDQYGQYLDPYFVTPGYMVPRNTYPYLENGARPMPLMERPQNIEPAKYVAGNGSNAPVNGTAGKPKPDVKTWRDRPSSSESSITQGRVLFVNDIDGELVSGSENVKGLFCDFGQIENVNFIADALSERPCHSAIVTFRKSSSARKAFSQLAGKQYGSRRLQISFVDPQEETRSDTTSQVSAPQRAEVILHRAQSDPNLNQIRRTRPRSTSSSIGGLSPLNINRSDSEILHAGESCNHQYNNAEGKNKQHPRKIVKSARALSDPGDNVDPEEQDLIDEVNAGEDISSNSSSSQHTSATEPSPGEQQSETGSPAQSSEQDAGKSKGNHSKTKVPAPKLQVRSGKAGKGRFTNGQH